MWMIMLEKKIFDGIIVLIIKSDLIFFSYTRLS